MVDLFKRFNGNPYKIRVFHLREIDTKGNVLPTGGMTRVTLEDESRNVLAEGTSVCVSTDTFNRRVGRNLAIRRALRELDLKHRRNHKLHLTEKGIQQVANSINETAEDW